MKYLSIIIITLLSTLLTFESFGGDSTRKHLKKAQKYRNLNKFESSENEYLLAIQEDPNNFQAQFELGLLYESAFFDPQKALDAYKKAEKVMNDTVYELFFHLGKSYHHFEKYDDAIKYYNLYKKGAESGSDGAIVTDYSLKKIEEARFAKTYQTHHLDGMMINLGDKVNTGFSEYVPVLIEKDSSLLFTRRGTENLGDYYWDNMYYEDMYVSKFKDGELTQAESFKGLNGPLDNINNTKKHESVVEISPSGDTLILYQKNKLWYSTFTDGKWSEPEKFGNNINISGYQRHGCLSPDGKSFFFSSDDKDGNGGFDLYVSHLEDGEWGEAKNLGNGINSTGNEDAPFISKDGKSLYFSSTGHEGMGGYDVFVSQLENGVWSAPLNLGTPVNSPADDIYFKVQNDDLVFVSSDRAGGFGNMDIYKFRPYGIPEFKDCISWVNKTYTVKLDARQSVDKGGVPLIYEWELGDGGMAYGKVLEYTYQRPGTYTIKLNAIDSLTGVRIYNQELIAIVSQNPITIGSDDIHIEIYGLDTVKVGSDEVYDATVSQVPEDSITHYYWTYKKELYQQDTLSLSFPEVGSDTIYMEVISRDAEGFETHRCVTKVIAVLSEKDFDQFTDQTDSNEIAINIGGNNGYDKLPDGLEFNLENIYFDFDKFNIRKDAKETMTYNIDQLKSHPNVVIKVIGHTDAMGSNSYNMKLAEKRAKKAVEYLVSKGISLDRILATISKGEEDPAAPNTDPDGSDNPKNRQKNRRVEFYVVGINK